MKQKLQKLIRKARRSEAIAFSEKPADVEESSLNKKTDKKELTASALFSIFTADIIKEEKIFTR